MAAVTRTLRSKRQRWLLWQAAGGKCQLCGVELDDTWEADHVVPWRLTHRTNVHEMQALCASCNGKKGGRMPIDMDRAYAALRPGQIAAIKTAVRRLWEGQSRTSLVLPPRYGKTDTARVILAYCLDQRIASVGLFLTVSEGLRTQATDPDSWEKCWVRCGITVPISRREIKFQQVRYNANGERFLSVTIQLVQQNLPNFCDWADSIWNATGLPVLVFVDECHTGSEKNTWGHVAAELIKHHALVVLLTATAVRSDGEAIEGFELKVLESKPESHVTTRPAPDPRNVLVDFWDGERRRVRLQADWETKFRDAWREEPSPLCKLSWVPFDVDLMMVQSDLTGAERQGRLSEKSASEVRRILGRLVRDSRVIHEGVRRLVRELRFLRDAQPSCGAIVFCGNDSESGGEHVDDHAKAIVREIERCDPGLTCLVATTNQGDEAVKTVRRFANSNVGDVLIVKQMASIGLDAPRLKVCLDLSPIRQDGACIQRWFRTLTPFGTLRVGTVICPADCLSLEIFREWVEREGGAQDQFVGDVVKTIEVPKKDPIDKPITLISDTGDADFEDSHLNRATRELQSRAYAMVEAFPMLLERFSHAEIITKAQRLFDREQEDAGAVLSDLTGTIEAEQDNISAIVDDVVQVRYHRGYPGGRRPYDGSLWQDTVKTAWGDVYRDAGVTYGKGGLRKITDMRTLTRLKVVAEILRNQEVSDGDAVAPTAS